MIEVTDLTQWDGVGGLYIMVLAEYRQVYVGATSSFTGIAKRIRQHWTNQKQFDRLIWGDVDTSILSIDSFRALDTPASSRSRQSARSKARTLSSSGSRRSSCSIASTAAATLRVSPVCSASSP
ncbi:hypothetical protein [Microbacterium sp. 3J1]|uniref:hypothetical protein n=1 Tax=Microbacterium sp. 3J1 TaxID=861269 RepID=UPI000A589DD9|nr:hypothetical protein [Microbacterium sp. 3J1]